MTFTIPAANRTAGQAGFMTDINAAYAALAAVAAVNVLDTAYAGGADNTGASACDAAFAAAVAALPVNGGLVVVPAGDYRLNTGVSVVLGANAGPVQFWLQPGAVIHYWGSGDCFRMYSTPTASPTGWRSGIVGDGLIEGSHASAGACGIHIGDIPGIVLHTHVKDFGGAGSKGVHFDNTITWTEEGDVRMVVEYCTQNVVFEVTTGYPSFDYGNWDFTILANPGQDGVVLLNGANMYGTSMRIRGNFFTQSTTFTNYVLKLIGQTPGGSAQPGTPIKLYGNLEIQVETDGGLTYTHAPLLLDASTAPFLSCLGRIKLLGFAATSSLAANSFVFGGMIQGDSVLNPAGINGIGNFGNGTVYPQAITTVTIPFLPTPAADFFSFTLSANITLDFRGGLSTTASGPQRKTIIIKQAASGGPYTVTWPSTGSPSNTSPTVKWAGGTAPTMTAAASAIDVYDLETYDGITWYGTAKQAMS